MNSCILMAEIIQDPELRYTSDNQTPLAQMLVQFPGQRAEDPVTTLKVVGWGNFASEIKENYRVGDRVIIEGRLGMNTIDRPEGFKEKRAELTASRIYKLGADTTFEPHVATPAASNSSYEATPAPAPAPAPKSNNVVVPMRSKTRGAAVDTNNQDRDYAFTGAESTFEPTIVPSSSSSKQDQNLDDIPF
ncbi:MAG: single-stranded DNA-binding protein [Coleofasciculaceae cyanobacterium]